MSAVFVNNDCHRLQGVVQLVEDLGFEGVLPSSSQEKKEYISCLKTSRHESEKCKHLSKKYLECRMEKNLMAKQDMAELGFRNSSQASLSGDTLNQV